ncbi:MAG: WecB/TagA/CpsF family glycosyltransferase [Pirellulaceae bacterium]|nr:WecB/TagA/CpsF family glycosyltransferase [Pirellulaceae bacterium]
MSATNYLELTQTILQAAALHQSAIVSCHAVHAIVTASDAPELCHKVNSFEAVTPDGQPVRWALRWLHGIKLKDRVYGPELTLRVCEAAAKEKVGVYLYGGTPDVLERLNRELLRRFPDLVLAGEAPPFRPLTAAEDQAVIERIAASGAGIVLIGLGCPKQDEFAFAHRHQIDAVQICVGAAFNFHAGVQPMAPSWMQRNGLEWLFRLYQEPQRLWRRYLHTNSRFLYLLLLQMLRTRGAAD